MNFEFFDSKYRVESSESFINSKDAEEQDFIRSHMKLCKSCYEYTNSLEDGKCNLCIEHPERANTAQAHQNREFSESSATYFIKCTNCDNTEEISSDTQRWHSQFFEHLEEDDFECSECGELANGHYIRMKKYEIKVFRIESVLAENFEHAKEKALRNIIADMGFDPNNWRTIIEGIFSLGMVEDGEM